MVDGNGIAGHNPRRRKGSRPIRKIQSLRLLLVLAMWLLLMMMLLLRFLLHVAPLVVTLRG
jgi:hypothetical protein